uniref:Expressed protein n=2 Tax=Schizophyllum commune (strain H4-8 / FGSC 9210) TaxID=578458 RepID=D8PSZ5_SCHCM
MLPSLTHLDFTDLHVDSQECVYLLEAIVEARVHRRARDAIMLKFFAYAFGTTNHACSTLSVHWNGLLTGRLSKRLRTRTRMGKTLALDRPGARGYVENVPDDGASGSGGVDIDADSDDDWAKVDG